MGNRSAKFMLIAVSCTMIILGSALLIISGVLFLLSAPVHKAAFHSFSLAVGIPSVLIGLLLLLIARRIRRARRLQSADDSSQAKPVARSDDVTVPYEGETPFLPQQKTQGEAETEATLGMKRKQEAEEKVILYLDKIELQYNMQGRSNNWKIPSESIYSQSYAHITVTRDAFAPESHSVSFTCHFRVITTVESDIRRDGLPNEEETCFDQGKESDTIQTFVEHYITTMKDDITRELNRILDPTDMTDHWNVQIKSQTDTCMVYE